MGEADWRVPSPRQPEPCTEIHFNNVNQSDLIDS